MPYSFKELLEDIAIEKAPGPAQTFSLYDIVSALELIAEKPVGRSKLAKSLDVGEGSVRTIIERLKSAGLISISKSGCVLTKKGLQFWTEYKSVFGKETEIEGNELTLTDCNYAVLVKKLGCKIKSGVEQRDAAIMAGAKGATTIVVGKRHLIIPSVSNDVAKDFPEAAQQANALLQPEENDVIIMVSAATLKKAKYGALAAAWTLLGDC